MKLAFGKNKVSIKAIDPAGNQSSFEGTITRAIGADFIRLVIFFIIIALSIVFIVFLYNKKKRGNN
jgi:large-conductance mechanosensitive channel